MSALLSFARILACTFLMLLASPSFAEIYVIVNANNEQRLDADDVERIFMRKMSRFENGAAAEPLGLPEGSVARGKFNEKVLQRDEQQLKYYWARKMFSGGDRPPPTVANEAEMLEMIAAKPGGIGYVPTLPKDPRVRVVLHVGK